jgi:hypothetical protein
LPIERTGVEHQLLGQPLQVAAGLQGKDQVLLGPAAGRVAAGAADAAVHLLGRHAGEQGAAAGPEARFNPQLIAPHQAAGGVQQRQFAVAAGLGKGPLQFQRGAGTPLVAGVAPVLFKA